MWIANELVKRVAMGCELGRTVGSSGRQAEGIRFYRAVGVIDRTRKGVAMATYVSLINWTEQGIQNFQETTQRAQEFTRLVEGNGGTVRELLWTIGEYDLVHVSEFASDEKAAAAFLRLASAGNVRSRILRAYTAAEMKEVINLTGVRMEHGSWG